MTGSATGSGERNPAFSGSRADGRGEGPLQRADRNMIELLQELRVAQTGVQILFAFLLTLSFTERFDSIDAVQRWTYIVTLLCSVVTAGLLVAPAAVHRVTFRRGVKAETVQLGHRLFTLGLGTLVLTLTGAVLLVLDVAVGRTFAIWTAGALGVVLTVLWFVVPLPVRRAADEEERPDGAVDEAPDAQSPRDAPDQDGPDQADRGTTGGTEAATDGSAAQAHAGRALT